MANKLVVCNHFIFFFLRFFFPCVYDPSLHRLCQSVCVEGLQLADLLHSTPGCTPLGWAGGWCLWQPRRRNGCSLCQWHRWSESRWSYRYLDSGPQTSWGWTPALLGHPSVDLERGKACSINSSTTDSSLAFSWVLWSALISTDNYKLQLLVVAAPWCSLHVINTHFNCDARCRCSIFKMLL